MTHTRIHVLTAAFELIAVHGTRRLTMAHVAQRAGVAKATIYNHFRTKSELLQGVLLHEVEKISAVCVGRAPGEALRQAARLISDNQALRRLRHLEPEVLATALLADRTGPGWRAVQRAVVQLVAADRPIVASDGAADAEVPLDWAVRWLVSFVFQPAVEGEALEVPTAPVR